MRRSPPHDNLGRPGDVVGPGDVVRVATVDEQQIERLSEVRRDDARVTDESDDRLFE